MSWLGDSISSLTGQITNFTREVLTENSEEFDDGGMEPQLSKPLIKDLQSQVLAHKQEIDRLQIHCANLEERSQTAELQLQTLSQKYRRHLLDKDNEIKYLKQKQAGFNMASYLESDNENGGETTDGGVDFVAVEEADVDDIIKCQLEINRLNRLANQLNKEKLYWQQVANANQSEENTSADSRVHVSSGLQQPSISKSLVKETFVQQEVESAGNIQQVRAKVIRNPPKDPAQEESQDVHNQPAELLYDNEGNGEELFKLRSRLKEVDTLLRRETEQHQHEMTSLQELHEHEIDRLKSKHETELQQLQQEKIQQEVDEPSELQSKDEHQNDSKKFHLFPMQEEQENTAKANTECQRLSAALSCLEEKERENESIIHHLTRQLEKLQQEKQEIVIENSSSACTESVSELQTNSTEEKTLLDQTTCEKDLIGQKLGPILNEKDVGKSLPTEGALELEICHLREEVMNLTTTCEELEVEKTTLNEELVKIKQTVVGEVQIRRNKTDDNKELETVQRRLHALEDEVAKLVSERDTFESSLEELDVQHQQAIEQILSSRDLVQNKYKQVLTENEALMAKLKACEKETLGIQKSLEKLSKSDASKNAGSEQEVVQALEMVKEFQSLWDFLLQNDATKSVLQKESEGSSNKDKMASIKNAFVEAVGKSRENEEICQNLRLETALLQALNKEQENVLQQLNTETSNAQEKSKIFESRLCELESKDEQSKMKEKILSNERDILLSKLQMTETQLQQAELEMHELRDNINLTDKALNSSENRLHELKLVQETSKPVAEKESQTAIIDNLITADVSIQTDSIQIHIESVQQSSDSMPPNTYNNVSSLHEQISELQLMINTLENRLAEKERHISGMDDILRVYKDNLDPDQEVMKRQQLEMVQKYETQLKTLESERDRMMAVLNDKARENSNLKMEVHRLVNVAAAERTALAKLQRDCEELSKLKSAQKSETDDAAKEAMRNLARLVHDRELEIEALQQKNSTLSILLQETDSAVTKGNEQFKETSANDAKELPKSSTIQNLLAEREELSKVVQRQQVEREQIINSLNQKHQESISYHAEIQRLLGMLEQESRKFENLQEQHSTIVRQFDEKQQAFLEVQNESVLLKQRLSALEQLQDNLKVKYDRLLLEDGGQPERKDGDGLVEESESSTVRVDRHEWNSKLAELENLTRAIQDKDKLLCEKDHVVHEKMRHIEASKELCQRKDEEIRTAKQHYDRLNEQLQISRRETEEARIQNSTMRGRMEDSRSEIAILKETNSALSVTLQEREFELKALRENMNTLSSLVEQQASKENKGEEEERTLKRLLNESEEMRHKAQGFQTERDQALLALAHQQRENEQLREQIHGTREREERLLKELDRLRNHLLLVEDGYTQEALRAEEREKELRNRLSQAEDRIQYATSSHTAVSHNASMQVESLQEQLKTVVDQRDEILVKLSLSEDQIAQKSAALHTLQVVLEQLQQERQRDIATAQTQHNATIYQEKQRADLLAKEVRTLEARLQETSEALQAASRLSEQIDRKEGTIKTLREEVEFQEMALQKAKHEIEHFKTNTEVTVDKTIIKNLMVGFLTVPSGKQKDVLRVIATILDFNKEEREKVGAGIDEIKVGWISSWLVRKSPPSSPVYRPMAKQPVQQSLSQAFVRFLESESQPRPQLKFPTESLVASRESSQKPKPSNSGPSLTPTPNPFSFTLLPQSEASTSNLLMGPSHLLMKPMATALPTFSPSPVSGWSSSTNSILRDVLEKD